MTTRRTFLRLLGIGAPAAAVATQLPEAQPTFRFVGTERNTGDAVWEPRYSDIGTEPDLQSLIYDVPPTETPFMRPAKRG